MTNKKENEEYKYTPDIEGYKTAVWDFLLEHSEITDRGSVFIKFHTDGKKNFENRVLSRWKYNYHREDVQAKSHLQVEKKKTHIDTKTAKKAKWKAEKKARIAKLKRKNIFNSILFLLIKPFLKNEK